MPLDDQQQEQKDWQEAADNALEAADDLDAAIAELSEVTDTYRGI